MNSDLNNYTFIKNLTETAPEQKNIKETIMILAIVLAISTAAAIYFYVEMKKREAQSQSLKQTGKMY